MGANALADGLFGRRAAVAGNLALHPDRPDEDERTGVWGRRQLATLRSIRTGRMGGHWRVGTAAAVNLTLYPDGPDGGPGHRAMGLLGGGPR